MELVITEYERQHDDPPNEPFIQASSILVTKDGRALKEGGKQDQSPRIQRRAVLRSQSPLAHRPSQYRALRRTFMVGHGPGTLEIRYVSLAERQTICVAPHARLNRSPLIRPLPYSDRQRLGRTFHSPKRSSRQNAFLDRKRMCMCL